MQNNVKVTFEDAAKSTPTPNTLKKYERVVLFESEETLVFKKQSATKSASLLVINRDTAEMSLRTEAEINFNEKKYKMTLIDALLGAIRLNGGLFFVCVTEKEAIGSVRGFNVWRTVSFRIVRSAATADLISTTQAADDRRFVALLMRYLTRNTYYFSYDYDITWPIARQPEGLLPELCNRRFLFNAHFIDVLMKQFGKFCKEQPSHAVQSFCVPLIQGFVGIANFSIGASSVQLCLLSRRSPLMGGMRFHARGCDDRGNAANFVETEQILLAEDRVFSFVQVRGSLPFSWSHLLDMRYKPPICIGRDATANAQMAQAHFGALSAAYGAPVVAVSLINAEGYEQPLGNATVDVLEAMRSSKSGGDGHSDVVYYPFDFHHECKEHGWERLTQLGDALTKHLDDCGFWELRNGMSTVASEQRGIVRVNCIDCLDRTNVFQGVIARIVLLRQLRLLSILGAGDTTLASFPEAERVFKTIWADNGDAISMIYTGTPALKSDFTRTGRRSLFGVAADGVKSVRRYFLNNYADADYEDAVRLLSGAYRVSRNNRSPFKRKKPLIQAVLLSALIYFLMNFLVYAFYLRSWPKSLIALLAVWKIYKMILARGTQFVATPKLAMEEALCEKQEQPPPAVPIAKEAKNKKNQ